MDSKSIHISEMQKQMDIARIRQQQINLKAWKSDGTVIEYHHWLVKGGHGKGGHHRLLNPVNKEVRTVPDIYIFEFCGKSVYL